MAVTVLAWNLEDLGTRYGNRTITGMAYETFRAAMIANVVLDAGADVLVLQEMRVQGTQFLPTIRQCLNTITGTNEWHYDYLPGSVVRAPPNVIGDLGYTSEGHKEGYAVVYRNGFVMQDPNTRSAGEDGSTAAGYFLDLVLDGRQIVFNNTDPQITFHATATGVLGFPSSTCGNANMSYSLRSGPSIQNASIIQQLKVRRPCQLTVTDPNGGGGFMPLSLVVYHAPVGQNHSYSPLYGTLIGFAAGQLRAGPRGYLGDFNIISNNDLGVLYARANALSFTNQTHDGNGYANTSVHAAVNTTTWHTGTGVLTEPRDIGLCTTDSTVDIPPVFTAFTQNNSNCNTFLNNQNHADYIRNILLPDRANLFPNNAAGVLGYFYGGAQPGGVDMATATALIFNLVLSDHLPVRIRKA